MTLLTNPYQGVNAHLNSWLQRDDEWKDFHAMFLATLRTQMTQELLSRGYRVVIERSIQIRFEEPRPRGQRQPDFAIIDTYERSSLPHTLASSPSEVLMLEDLLEDDLDTEYAALAIYHVTGKMVLWLELLSPTNTPPRSGYQQYQRKRHELLQTDCAFIEIDLLHEQPATWTKLPDYTRSHDYAAPYQIVVVPPTTATPHPLWLFRFGIDDALPTFDVPLTNGDAIAFDLQALYQTVFTQNAYGADLDYTLPPVQFDAYTPADQRRILAVMRRIEDATER